MSGPLDRFKLSIANVVRALIPSVDYLRAHYPGRVLKQNADGTLQIRPDATTLPDMTDVPIYSGVPGMTVEVAAGARVYVAFSEGSPQKPIAHLWESASVTRLNIDATQIVLNGGTKTVARKGDAVSFTLTSPPGGGPVTGTITIDDGAPGVLA